MDKGDGFAEVDRLVAARQLQVAAEMLEGLLTRKELAGPDVITYWLKLAGLRRALRQPRKALDAAHHALALSPFDFMALVMRAGLLEGLEDPGAGQAWGEAIAQRPHVPLAPPLAAAFAAGEAFHTAWLDERARRLEQAAAKAAVNADDDQDWRITRFRNNILHKTRVYHSEPTHFHYPGLLEREFFPRHMTPWLAELEGAFKDIRAEMLALLHSERAELEPYVQYEDHQPLAQWRLLNRNKDWSAIHLLKQGRVITDNAEQVPCTMDILSRMPQPQVEGASPNAMFSLLAPRTAIPPHVGVDNTRLVCHLPLVVPEGCWFRVGAETRLWREGEAFAFDDTIEHEAMNPSDVPRIVLIFDAWHPGLAEVERAAVAATIAADRAGEPRG